MHDREPIIYSSSSYVPAGDGSTKCTAQGAQPLVGVTITVDTRHIPIIIFAMRLDRDHISRIRDSGCAGV